MAHNLFGCAFAYEPVAQIFSQSTGMFSMLACYLMAYVWSGSIGLAHLLVSQTVAQGRQITGKRCLLGVLNIIWEWDPV